MIGDGLGEDLSSDGIRRNPWVELMTFNMATLGKALISVRVLRLCHSC